MRYREYKKVDIPWLDEVPSHWEVVFLKNISEIYTGNSIPDDEKKNYTDKVNSRPYISTKDITRDNNLVNYNNGLFIKVDNHKFRIAGKNSTLVCIEGGSGGEKVAYLTEEVSFVNKLCCIKSTKNSINDKYIYYTIQSSLFKDQYSMSISGDRNGVSLQKLGYFQNIIPPKEEQEQIARFLDWKINEIDRLIEIKKKNIITLDKFLNEYIKKILSNYNRKTTRLKNIAKSNLLSLNGNEEIDTINYLEISDVGTGFLRKSPENIIFRDAPSRARRIVNENNIIISTVRTYLKSIYKIKSREKDCIVSTGFSVLEIDPKHNIDYIYFVLLSDEFLDNVQRVSYGVSYPAISDSQLMNLKLSIVEDKGKQDEIVEKLFRLQKTVDKNTKNIQSQINNLKLLKQSLISDVVTGKMDVRNISIPEYGKVSDIEDDVILEENFSEEV